MFVASLLYFGIMLVFLTVIIDEIEQVGPSITVKNIGLLDSFVPVQSVIRG